MEMGSEEWIQASLERLEQLEQQRDGLAAELEAGAAGIDRASHQRQVDALDTEIRDLYAQLEQAAEEGEAAAAGQDSAPDVPAPAPSYAAAASQMAADEDDDLDSPFAAAPPSMAAADMGSSLGGAPSYSADIDEPRGGAMKFVLGGAAVLAVGAVAYYFLVIVPGQKVEPEAPKESGPPKVINAASVPEDTQGVQGAKGADVDRTPTREELEAGRKKSGGGGGGGGGGGAGSTPKPRDKKNQINLQDSDDPL